jgi:DNA-binding transcriptional LysR family regulator
MSIPSLADLQVFAAVARLRSFRKAAAELNVSPSALSHTLRILEERLGVRLINRTTRSVAPTEIGERLLARLAPALLDIQGALDEVNDFRASPVGTLRINAPRSAAELVLLPLLTQFLSLHPGMKVDLVTDDALVDIVAEGFDAGVRFGERLQQDMVAIPLGQPLRMTLVASPGYLATHGTPQSPRELNAHQCICRQFSGGVLYRWQFARAGQRMEIDVTGSLTVGDSALMVRAAEDGLGLAYTFAPYAAAGLASGKLRTLLDDWCPQQHELFLYYPSRKLMPAGLKCFVAMLQQGRRDRQTGPDSI